MAPSTTDLPRDDTIPESLSAFFARFPHERACGRVLRRRKYGEDGVRGPRPFGRR